MDRSPEYAKVYTDKILDYERKGYICPLSATEALTTTSKTWYLPHFGVVNPNKPGKFRLVFDAASRSQGISLNDALLPGPDYLLPLPSVLFRFRRQLIGFIGDIAEMFHMVKVIPDDRQAQRFLWREMGRKSVPSVYEMLVMTFGATCSPAAAQFVKNRNANEFKGEFPEAVEAIVNGHYVDDYPDSTDSQEEAIQRVLEVIEVHRRGGFTIRSWMSSEANVLQAIPQELRATGEKDLSPEVDLPVERVLGLRWDPNADEFLFALSFNKVDPSIVNASRHPTKRDALKLVMSIFDPLGFLSCFQIKGKIILQEIWRSGIGWDDPVTEPVMKKWELWLKELQLIINFRLSRHYFPASLTLLEDVQLHVFCDASKQAFAAVAYFRFTVCGEVGTSFVLAKSRVAPVKTMSVPRLELQSALMGARLADTISKGNEVGVERRFLWVDSRTVYHWIKSEARRFKVFVAHRVGEIADQTTTAEWNWLPTKLNVADEATRDEREVDFSQDGRWLNGPEFLLHPESTWPRTKN